MVPVASTPSMSTRPPVGSSNPAMMLKMVVFPQPEGPIRLTKRPCGMASVTGASARKAPLRVWNVMLTSATQSFGAEDDMRTPRDGIADLPPQLYRKIRANHHGSSGARADAPHFASALVAALRMGDHRAISALTKLLNFAGVRSSLLGSAPPRSANRAWTSGLSSAWSSAAASFSTTAFGVLLGAKFRPRCSSDNRALF